MVPYSFVSQEWADRREYKTYLDARERILAMLDWRRRSSLDSFSRPSTYWSEELQRVLYMLDASPEIVRLLRHHTFPITGVNTFGYRSNTEKAKQPFVQKLRALQELDRTGLLVPEARDLGGFGYEIDGELYNIDTLKFYEAFIAMDLGGVLATLKLNGMGHRHVVIEVGGGWGGLGYQFKTLFPNTTYVIVDLPEVLLFSSAYLLNVLPDARAGFLVEGSEDIEGDWTDYDLIFVPNFHLEQIRPGHVDLLLNTVSFMEMTEEQVEAYVGKAWSLDCKLVYSLNRPHSLYNDEVTDVDEVISRWYFANESHVLDVAYTQLELSKGKKQAKVGKGSKRSDTLSRGDLTYRHLVGWRRPIPR